MKINRLPLGFALLMIVVCACEETRAQHRGGEDDRIETERHDFTQSTQTVPRGRAQLEFGYSFLSNDDETSHTLPELMFRYGLTENVEVRLRHNSVWLFGEDDRQGSEDLRPSLKFGLTDQQGWFPESALELRMSVPTGADSWTTNRVEAGVDYIYAWKLSESTKLYGSTGWLSNAIGDFSLRPENVNDNFSVVTQSIALGFEFTERVTAYGEFYGGFTRGFEDNERDPVFFNIGADYYLTNDFVLDARIGKGLTSDADDFFVGIGGSIRF